LNVRVEGQVTLNSTPHIVLAALEGLGIAFLPEEEFVPHIEEGRLVRVLEDWCAPFEGYYLYYPSRRQPSPAFSLVLAGLRLQEPTGKKRR
jgi:DNA-binding transcriptional LysR family regulator